MRARSIWTGKAILCPKRHYNPKTRPHSPARMASHYPPPHPTISCAIPHLNHAGTALALARLLLNDLRRWLLLVGYKVVQIQIGPAFAAKACVCTQSKTT